MYLVNEILGSTPDSETPAMIVRSFVNLGLELVEPVDETGKSSSRSILQSIRERFLVDRERLRLASRERRLDVDVDGGEGERRRVRFTREH